MRQTLHRIALFAVIAGLSAIATSARGQDADVGEPAASPSPTARVDSTEAPDALVMPDATPTPAPALSPASAALPSAAALESMSLEELLDVPIAVASRGAARSLRESPGVVTLVTREQIEDSGARDLMDVLLLVPGFSFGVDVEGVVGPGFRGNWAEEGKVLLLVDGHAMNELLYLNMPLGNRFPVDQIERVEIIRGPGSVAYGGAAELGVVNVVTRGSRELDGHPRATMIASQTPHADGKRDVTLAWGHAASEPGALSLSLAGAFGTDNRSDATYADSTGLAWQMANDSGLQDAYLNAQLGWHGLDLRFLSDDYTITERDGFGPTYLGDVQKEFQQNHFDARYPIDAGGEVVITPRFSYARESTWRSLKDETFADGNTSSYYDPITARYVAEVTATAPVASHVRAFGGASFTRDDYFPNSTLAGVSQHGLVDRIFGGGGTVDDHGIPFGKHAYGDGAAFGEIDVDTRWVNLVAGARFEDQSRFGNAFIPRVALTHAFDRAHVKLLASRAFRPPSLGNLDYNPAVKPELTTVLEAEAGYRFGENAFVSANVFDLSIEKPIVFTIAVNGTANYYNFARTGTQGAEITVQGSAGPLIGTATGSYYSAAGKNRVVDYAVPGHSDLTLGFPHDKATLTATARLGHGMSASTTAIWFGERYEVTGFDDAGNSIVVRDPAVLLLNAQLAWRRIADRLDVAIGAYNLLGSKFGWDEPYDGGHPALPAEPRELAARASWTF